jgi:hypothetical protein
MIEVMRKGWTVFGRFPIADFIADFFIFWAGFRVGVSFVKR